MPFDGLSAAPVTDLLLNAKNYLLTNGWCKGDVRRGNTLCMVFSIYESGFGGYKSNTSVRDAIDALCDVVGVAHDPGLLGKWNDHEERDMTDVLGAFDAAIAAVAAREFGDRP